RHTRFSRDWSSDVCSSDLFTGSAVAYALAAAQSDVANGRLNISENVGVAPIDGLYLEGRNQNGQTVLLSTWGSSQAITELVISRSEERRVGRECRSARRRD